VLERASAMMGAKNFIVGVVEDVLKVVQIAASLVK
jgi:hypothetical protein